MQKFSDLSKKVKEQNKELLIAESQELILDCKDQDDILYCLDIICENLIISHLTEREDDIIDKILSGEEVRINGSVVALSDNQDGLIINDKLVKFLGTPGLEWDIRDSISVMLDDLEDYVTEEFTQSDLDDAIFNLPDTADKLIGYETQIGSDKLTVDWEDPKSGKISLQINGKKVEGIDDERAYDYESVKDVILDVLGKLVKEKPEPEEKPKKEPKEITPEAKKKLQILRSVIRPRLINKFADANADQNRVYNAIKNYLESGEDEEVIKTELDQRALIDFCLDLLNVILSNKNLSNLISRDASVTSLGESYIVEGKKKKQKKTEETIDVKLDMLLKLGLVDKKIYNRAKRALSNKKSAGTVPYLRNLLFDLLDKLISYIKKDTTLYNRIRLNVMKEMKSSLPLKKELEEAKAAGKEAAKMGQESIVPEKYSHYFTKEAWIEGYNSWDENQDEEIITTNTGQDMKTFKEFKEEKEIYVESISFSEIDAIVNVVQQLSAIGESIYPDAESALTDISEIVSQIGVSFDAAEVTEDQEGFIDVPLDQEGDGAKLSVFGGESFEDKVEGDLSIRFSIQKSDEGVMVKPEIMVTFEGDEAMALSDIEFEADVDNEDESEDEDMEEEYCDACDSEDCDCNYDTLTEEYVDGKTFNVILFKPATRRFFSTILTADNEKDIQKLVSDEYPGYVINSIYPVKIS